MEYDRLIFFFYDNKILKKLILFNLIFKYFINFILFYILKLKKKKILWIPKVIRKNLKFL